MVCAEGLRVWRSCRNAVNQSGNGSASGARGIRVGRDRRAGGDRDCRAPLHATDKRWIINLIHQIIENRCEAVTVQRDRQRRSVTVTKPWVAALDGVTA